MDTNTTAHPELTAQSDAPPLPNDDPRSQANFQRRQTLRIAERDELGRLFIPAAS